MIRTPHFNFPYFQSGEIYSASVDAERAIAFDLLIKGLSDTVTDGIIDGWDISDEGGLIINISPGKGFIDGFYGVTQNEAEKTLSDDSTNYVYATRNSNIVDGVSTSSNKVLVNFIDTDLPSAPSGLQIDSVDERIINLKWNKNSDSDISYYKVYRKLNSAPSYSFISNVDHLSSDGLLYVSYSDENLIPETAYDYRISAIDLSGNESSFSLISSSTNPDITPASEVTNIRVFASSNAASFTWNASTSEDIDSYVITLSELTNDGSIYSTITINTSDRLYYFNNALKDNVRYRATIKTLDQYGNVSKGIIKEFVPKYNVAPAEVGAYSYLVSNIRTPKPVTPQLVVSWSASSSDVSHYNLYVYDSGVKGEVITVGNSLSKTLISFPIRSGEVIVNRLFSDSKDYEILLTVVDSVGNESDGIFLKASIPDYSPPPEVGNITVSVGDSIASLNWEASDVKDFSNYELYYWDNANLSSFSENVMYGSFTGNTFTLPVGVVGTYPIGSWVELVQSATSGGKSVKLLLTSALNPGDTSVVCNFIPQYYNASATIKITNPPSPEIFYQREHYSLSGLINSHTYTLILVTVDLTGNKSYGITLSATPEESAFDLYGPLSIVPKGRDREIKLTWSSVDGAAGYNIYRAGPLDTFDDESLLTEFSLLGTIVGDYNTTAYDIGLTNDVRYSYIVTSYIGSSESEYDVNDQVIASPTDTYNPDPPENLSAIIASGQVTLSWDPPSDITSIEGWNIYRNDQEYGIFSLIDSVPFTTLTYVDDGLIDGETYYYIVRSFSNTVDINTSISDVIPSSSILIGEVVTSMGDITSITPQRTIISNLENTIEAITSAFLKNHVHSADVEEEFSETRNQALKINLSKEEDITVFTTSDYQTYLSERDLDDHGSYIVYINDNIPNILYEVDFESNTIIFEDQLYSQSGSSSYSSPPVVRLQFINLKEISGELNSRFIDDLNASKIVSGILDKALLPSISHRGRIKEAASIRTYALLSDDNLYYDLNNITYVINDQNVQIELGTPTVFYDFFEYNDILYGASSKGVLKSEDGGIVWESHASFTDLVRKFYAKQVGDDMIYFAICRRKIYYTRDAETWYAMKGIDSVGIIHGMTEDSIGNVFLATDTGVYVYSMEFASSYRFNATSIIEFDSLTTEIVSIICTNEDDVVATTSNGVFMTIDLGENWSQLSSIETIYNVTRFGASRIIAINDEGYLVYSDDNGINWSTNEIFYGIDRNDIFKVINGRLFFTTSEGVFYSDDLLSIMEINGEFKRRITKSGARSIYGTNKTNVFISFDNKLYKWYNGVTTLWSEFIGVIPSVYVNGVLLLNGYYYNSDGNDLYFEWKNTYDDVFTIATTYDEYLLSGGGWQDIDANDVEVSTYVNNVYLGSESSSDLSDEFIDVEEETEVVLNKRYEFAYDDQRKITIHSADGKVYISGPQLTKFDEISVSIANVTFRYEGIYSHDDIDDALSKKDIGLPFGLGNTYLDGILQMGLYAEHNFVESIQTNSQYPYASTRDIRSFNSELINTEHFIFGKNFYDVFNSTIDYVSVASNRILNPSPFTIRDFYEVNGETWVATDRNIFALSYDRLSIDREISISSVDLDITSIKVIGDYIYVVGSDSVHISEDGGLTWSKNEGYGLPKDLYQINSIFNIIMIGCIDGVYYSSQGSSSWTKCDFYDADASLVTITKQVSSLIVSNAAYCLIDNIVYRSVNGITWKQFYLFDSLEITGLVADRLFQYRNTVFALTNKGLYNDLGSLSNVVTNSKFEIITIDSLDSAISTKDFCSCGNNILVIANRNTLYRSSNSGNSWSKQTISSSDFIDLCHIWERIKITTDSITSMNLVGVPTLVTDKLITIIDTIYSTDELLRDAIQILLTDLEYNNYGDIIVQNSSYPYETTEIVSSLDDIYIRLNDLSFEYSVTVARADRAYNNSLRQPINVSSNFDKVSVYLSPKEITGTDYSITMEIYGADSSNNIISGILSSDTKSASEFYGPGWYNFRIYYNGSYSRIILAMVQNYGDNNNFVKWDHSISPLSLGAINNDGSQSYTYNYDLWRFEDASDDVNLRLSSDPAEDLVEIPDIGNGNFYQTELDDDKIKLSLNPKVLSFIVDQSGSQTWNDYYGLRFDLIRQFTSDLNNIYPGDLYYALATYGSKIINSLNIELVESGDDYIYGDSYVIVRRTDTYPATPIDGSIIANTSLTVSDDDTVVNGTTYYYSIFNMRSDSSYSIPRHVAITVRDRQNPLPITGLNLKEVVVKDTIGIPSAEVDTGKRKIEISFRTIQDYSSYYDSVRIVRKECYEDEDVVSSFSTIESNNSLSNEQISTYEIEDDKIFNCYDGTVIYEGLITSGENIIIDDFSGMLKPINGIKYYYSIYTKNSSGNYCLPENALQKSIRVSSVWREWVYDTGYEASQIPAEFLVSPLDVSDFTIEEGNTQNKISWTLPVGDTAIGVMLFVDDVETPNIDVLDMAHLDATGTTGSISSNDSLSFSGNLIYQGVGDYYVHRELENNKKHYYRLYTFDRVRTMSSGETIGAGAPRADVVDDFEPPDAKNFYAEIFNDERIILRWDRKNYFYESLIYFDENVSVKSFAFDESGTPLDEIDNFDIVVNSAKFVEKIVPEFYGGGGGQEVDISSNNYTIINDKDSYDGEIRSSISLINLSSPLFLSYYNRATFIVKSEYKIYDLEQLQEDQESPEFSASELGINSSLYSGGMITQKNDNALTFSVESDILTFSLVNPLNVYATNKYPETQKIAQKEQETDVYGNTVDVVVYYDGVYSKSGMSYYGDVEVQFNREALNDDDVVTCSAYVYELSHREKQDDDTYKRIWKQTPSEIFVLESNTIDLENREINVEIDTSDGSEVIDRLTTATVGTFRLLPSDQAAELNVLITTTVNGYTDYSEHFLVIKTMLNVDVDASAPLADGRDVAEQFADVYVGPPKYDEKCKIERTPVANGTLVKWELEKGRFGQDRPFYSSESVYMQEGIYSVVRNGIARNIFFGPASDVKRHIVQNSDGTIDSIGEEYTIKASCVYDGMFGRVEEEVEIKPLEETGTSYRFYMTNGYEMQGHVIYADGSTLTNLEIHSDPLVTGGDGGQTFYDCLNIGDMPYISLSDGQKIELNDPNLGNISEEDAEIIYIYDGNEYTSVEDIDVRIESGRADVSVAINAFIGPPPEEKEDASEIPEFSKCYFYGFVPNDTGYPPIIDFSGTTQMIFGGSSITMFGGGSRTSGIPPVVVILKEPLNVQFQKMMSLDSIVINPPNDGINSTDIYFEVSFSEGTVPDGTLIKFDFLFYDGDKEITVEQINALTESERRAFYAGFSSYEDFISEINLSSYGSITSTVNGKSVAYCTLNPTKIKNDAIVSVRATSTYDEKGTIERSMSDVAKIKITGVDDNEGGSSVYLKNVERYDTVSDAWVEIDPMLVGRVGASCVYDPTTEKTFVISGLTEYGISVTGEQFEYSRTDKSVLNDSYGIWSYISDITYARGFSQSVLYNDKIYVFGGFGWNPFSGQSGANSNVLCEVYDIATDTWSRLADMPNPVSHGCAEVIGDNIYVFSGVSNLIENDNGHNYDTFNNYLIKYNVTSGVWTTIDSLDDDANALMRVSPTSYVKNNKIYVFGGILNEFNPDLYADALFVNSLVEIDVSDENNITYTVVSYTNTPIQRFRAGSYALLDDNFYVVGGSGIKQYVDGSVTRTYVSNTLRALESYDTTTGTWTTYRNLSKMTYERHSLGVTDDSEYLYAIGGGGSGYEPGKLLVKVILNPEEMKADGKMQVSASVELKDTTGEPPEDGIKMLIRGYVIIDSGESTQSVSATGITESSSSQSGTVNEISNKVSIYPVLFSNLTLYSESGAAGTIALERGEDILVALDTLVQYIDGDDTIIGIEYDEETKSVKVPKRKALEIKLGERRDLYKIIVEVLVEDDFYFGGTDTERALAANMSGYLQKGETGLLPGQMIDSDTGEIISDPNYVDPDSRDGGSSITIPEEAEQEQSPTLNVYNDITWIPYVNDNYEIMDYDSFSDEIDLLDQTISFGGSPHWDGLINFCQNTLKKDSMLFNEKIMIDVSDNEENLSKNLLTDAIDQIHLVDGYRELPVFTNMFITSFPPSLSARKGQADVVDLEKISGETLGLSHTIVNNSFISPVVRQIKIGSVGAVGRGTYIQTIDFEQRVHIINIKGLFELYQYTNGWIEVQYSDDGFNFTSAGIIFEADTITSLNVTARYLKFIVTLSSEFGNASLVISVPPPAFLSVQITYSEPNVQYVYTYSHDLSSYIREMYLTLNGDIPTTSNVQLGFTSSNSVIWDDYQTDSQPSVCENGKIVAVNSSMSLLNIESSQSGNTSLTYRTYAEILDIFTQEKQVEYGKVIDSIIILEHMDDSSDGSSKIVFADSTTMIISEAPDFSNAIDFSTIEGSDPTKYSTSGTILNYDFIYSIDGYMFVSKYGRWQPDSGTNVYRNGILVDPTEYSLIRDKGTVKFFERQRLTNNYAVEVSLNPKYRVGIAVTNRSNEYYAVLDDFAYIYNTNFVKSKDYNNSIPEVADLHITPLNVLKDSVFTANYSYSDSNNDVERNSEIQWYINGGIVPELIDKTTWSGSDLSKNTLKDGDRVFFTVRPSDGKIYGPLSTSTTAYIGDTPPTISGLTFVYSHSGVSSSTPDSDVDIYVRYTYYDTQGRAEVGTSIEWFIDGESLGYNSSDKSILRNSTTDSDGNRVIARGNIIQAKVRPSNGIIEGDLYETDEIVIQNSAPSLQNVAIAPASPTANSTLSVSYNFIDIDGDDDSTEIRWFKNGEAMTALNDLIQVNASNLTSGESWYSELTPYDGEDSGVTVRTSTVKIL